MNNWEKEWLANMREYQDKYDIRVVCQSPRHESVSVAQFTRVDSSMRTPSTEVRLYDDFVPGGAGVPTSGEYRRQHDAGQYSTSLTRDGDQPFDRDGRPAREHHELVCRQCGHKVPVRDENLQLILKQMEGKATVLTLSMLETLLHNKRVD